MAKAKKPPKEKTTFTCRCCAQNYNLVESIHVSEDLCVACNTKIQTFKENKRKIDFFRIYLDDKGDLTPIRQQKLELIELLNQIMGPTSIFDLSISEVTSQVEELKAKGQIGILKQNESDAYYYDYVPHEELDLERMLTYWEQYQERILKANRHKIRFEHFINFVGKESRFKTFKNKLQEAINKYIQTFQKEDLEEFKTDIFDEINAMEDAPLIPNIALFITKNYERIFYRFFTQILPFERANLTFSAPKAMSRTDYAIKITYEYDYVELRILKDAMEMVDFRDPLLSLSKWLILYCEKNFNQILDPIIQYHYERLKIDSEVRFITNVSSSSDHETKKYIRVSYTISSREW